MKSKGTMTRNTPNEFDPESAIIDAELLIKYRMINRAIETLERAIDSAPRHIGLREKLREILIDAGKRDQAAQHCLALASLHISARASPSRSATVRATLSTRTKDCSKPSGSTRACL